MSEALVELVMRMPPLRSPQVRLLLCAIAHLADDEGDCGPVSLKKLAGMTQSRAEGVSHHLVYLETDLGLIVRSEHSGTEPSRIRIHVDRLRNPSANQPLASHTHKVLGGPLDGQHTTPPESDLSAYKVIYSRRAPQFPQRPVLYRPFDFSAYGSSRANMRYMPAVMHHRGGDGTDHVYRLSSRTWLYSGVSTKPLAGYTRSHMVVSRLLIVDIVSIEEFDYAVQKWMRLHPNDGPADFASYLHHASSYLYAPGTKPTITETVARNLLRTHHDLSIGEFRDVGVADGRA